MTFSTLLLGIVIFYIGWGIWRLIDVDRLWKRYVYKAKSRGIEPETLERTPEWEKRERTISIAYIVLGIVVFCLGILFKLM